MPNLTPEHRLSALRTFEIASWDRIGGAPVAVRSRVRDILLAQFESQNARLEMDMGKVLVYTGTNAGMPFENQTGTPNNISLRSPSKVAANTRIIDLLHNAMPARDTSAQMEYV